MHDCSYVVWAIHRTAVGVSHTTLGHELAQTISTSAQSRHVLRSRRIGSVHLSSCLLAQWQATDKVGHEAQLLVAVVVLVLEVFVSLCKTLLLQSLLLATVSVLQLVDVHALLELLLAKLTELTSTLQSCVQTLEAEVGTELLLPDVHLLRLQIA